MGVLVAVGVAVTTGMGFGIGFDAGGTGFDAGGTGFDATGAGVGAVGVAGPDMLPGGGVVIPSVLMAPSVLSVLGLAVAVELTAPVPSASEQPPSNAIAAAK